MVFICLGMTSVTHAEVYPNPFDGTILHICEDEAEWPPYHHFRRQGTEVLPDVVGFGVDVITRILSRADIQFDIKLRPWKRCQQEVEAGEHFQLALSGSYSDERARSYHLIPYYRTQVYYFYSRRQYPDGLQIRSISELADYRLAGIRGYNYHYLGTLEPKVFKSIENHDAILGMLHLGRYDLTFEQKEVMQGFAEIGMNYMNDPDIGYAPLPGAPPTWFYMMATRHHPHAAHLHQVLLEGVADLFWSGDYIALLKAHGLSAD